MKDITMWIARDKDEFKDTYFYEKEPEFNTDLGIYDYTWKGFSFESPKPFGLRPGQKKKVRMVIE